MQKVLYHKLITSNLQDHLMRKHKDEDLALENCLNIDEEEQLNTLTDIKIPCKSKQITILIHQNRELELYACSTERKTD